MMPRIKHDFASVVAIRYRREDAVGCGHNGEQHEQGRSRQSPPQQGWRNQRQTRKHPHPHIAKIYGQSFAAGYPETDKLSEVLLQLNETSLSGGISGIPAMPQM